jgi:YfiH family protein
VFDGQAVEAVVTTREGGMSGGPFRSLNLGLHVGDQDAAVIENRRRAAGTVGAALGDLVFCNQTHGRRVAVVGAAERGRGIGSLADAIDDTDALVTAEPGVGLVMMAADCTPIVLYDPVAQVLGCVHSGWRGTTARVADAAIQAMTTLGAHPPDVIAALGPTVAPAGYQVGPDVAGAVTAAFGDGDGLLRPDDEGRWRLDLWAANTRVLLDSGVPSTQIHRSPLSSNDAPFFSDRAVRPCGRIAAIAILRA